MQVPTMPGLVRRIPVPDEPVVTKFVYFETPKPVVKKAKKPVGPKRAFKFQRFNCHKGHPLVEGNIYMSSGKRRCKTCHLNRCAESKIRRLT